MREFGQKVRQLLRQLRKFMNIFKNLHQRKRSADPKFWIGRKKRQFFQFKLNINNIFL